MDNHSASIWISTPRKDSDRSSLQGAAHSQAADTQFYWRHTPAGRKMENNYQSMEEGKCES